MAPIDPHSYTSSTDPLTTHISLTLYLSFPTSTIHGTALYTLPMTHTGTITLDTRSLTIHSVVDSDTLNPFPFVHSSDPHPILGQSLIVTLPSPASTFLISFSTSPSSSALQWLSPPQTSLKSNPFVYTQCQAIHARSVFPCQDTPAARIRYSARINLPGELTAVMAARTVGRRDPVKGEVVSLGEDWDKEWCTEGRAVDVFEMEQPIPPYLFAFAAGDIGWREVGPRTRVYAEGGVAVLDMAEREFAGTEEMIRVGEGLFGSYDWERFDLLVLPPSFPYGGMENPRLVF